ncbi:MAG TPA: amidohydrolase [Candidatus Pygmaiobacter gallistercoris]|nr:amidohydrolase [Candidatus Pygmaiobacter gallistercoris]
MRDLIFYGGPIVTMETEEMPEAVLVRKGRILFVGSLSQARALAEDAACIDLAGRALLPAFIDPHSHITALAQTLRLVDLHSATSFAQIQQLIREFSVRFAPAPGDWICGFGYDHNFLAEKRHPDRALLDAVCPETPLLIAHSSGHMGVANSAALHALGIGPQTPDPEGGRIGREADGKTPNGYLEETAFTANSAKIPAPSLDQQLKGICQAQQIYFSHGITTIQEGLARADSWQLLKTAADRGLLQGDVVCYLDLQQCRALAQRDVAWREYRQHLRIGGYKIFLDGSPQGRTAWLSEPYLGDDPNYRGYPTHSDAAVEQFMIQALEDQTQIIVHCNGDAAAQQMIDAYAAALKKTGLPGVRPVMIHAQILRRDQLEQMQKLGIFASFFVAHTWHWGDIHLANLGWERGSRISPAGSALRAGVCYTFHQDSPVLMPDMIDTLFCAVNRVTQSGVPLAVEERLCVRDALRGITCNAAAQYFEEADKGSITAGKRADLIILSENPLAVPPDQLRRLQVEQTFKDGVSVWKS